jgi:hypothetical protein
MTVEARKARRRLIAKRVVARKISETWKRKRENRRGAEAPSDDYGGMPETDAALDELPDSLVG